MKYINYYLISIFSGLLPMATNAATPAEQAEAFFERGLAAEQRGELFVADHCYALTLRVDPDHANAQAKIKELESREDWSTEIMAKKAIIANFTVAVYQGTPAIYREASLNRMCENITRETGIPVVLEYDSQYNGQINFVMRNATLATILEKLSEQSRYEVTYERRFVRISPPQRIPENTEPLPPLKPIIPFEPEDDANPEEPPLTGNLISVLGQTKEPTSSRDADLTPHVWRGKPGAFEFKQYDFAEPTVVDGCAVYWYGDGTRVIMPEYWRILYLNEDGFWMPVDAGPKPAKRHDWDVTRFSPVRTKGLRLVAQQLWRYNAGFLEWKIQTSDAVVEKADYPEELWLDELYPTETMTAYAPYRVNRYNRDEAGRGARVRLDGEFCRRFLFTHAYARIRFDVPPGYDRFTATAIGPTMQGRTNFSWSYRVLADGKAIFDGPSLDTKADLNYLIDVRLPVGTKTISLVVNSEGNNINDHAIWANPRLSRLGDTADPVEVPEVAVPDFATWIKTVQFRHEKGEGMIWAIDEEEVLHVSQTNPQETVLRFKIVSIDEETRTVTWKQGDGEQALRISEDRKRFEWQDSDKGFVPQPLEIVLRDSKIFGPVE